MPGRSRWPGLSSAYRTSTVRVAGSRCGWMNSTLPGKVSPGNASTRRLDGLPFADQAQLVLVDLGLDPDRVQVGDLEHREAFRHFLALDDVLLEHVAADRREDRDREVGLAVLEDLVDLGLGDPPPLELLGREPDQLLPIAEQRARPRRSASRTGIGSARRAAVSSSWIAWYSSGCRARPAARPPRRPCPCEIDVELLDPRLAGDLGDDRRQPPLVERDVADGRQRLRSAGRRPPRRS